MKEQYESNKAAKVGDEIKCPTCGTKFVKSRQSKVFCEDRCKNVFWGVENKGKYKKPERYYPINFNSCLRFLLFNGEVMSKKWWEAFLIGTLKQSIISNPSISYRVEGVSIGIGNPEWGAPLELCFILKVGE